MAARVASGLVALLVLGSLNTTVDTADGGVSAQNLVAGSARSSNGTTVQSGQPVVLRVLPSADSLARLAPGTTVPIVTVASTRTRPDGSFSFPSTVLRDRRLPAGLTTFSVDINSAGGWSSYVFEATAHERGRSVISSVATPPTITPATATAVHLVLHPFANAERGRVADGPNIVGPMNCYTKHVRTDVDKATTIGGTYLQSGYVGGKIIYTSKNTTKVAVGVSSSGKYGSFSGSGTSSASSGTAFYPNMLAHQESVVWRTKLDYSMDETYCPGDSRATRYYYRATSGAVGLSTAHESLPRPNYCYGSPAGHVQIQTGRGHTYASGASVAAVIGVNLSTEDDFTTDTTLDYYSGSSFSYCGESGRPRSSTGGRISAGIFKGRCTVNGVPERGIRPLC